MYNNSGYAEWNGRRNHDESEERDFKIIDDNPEEINKEVDSGNDSNSPGK